MEGPKYFVNEKTGQKIAVDQSAEIMRIQNLIRNGVSNSYVLKPRRRRLPLRRGGFARNLARMARHREDIFGDTHQNRTNLFRWTERRYSSTQKDGGDDDSVPPPPPKRTRYE